MIDGFKPDAVIADKGYDADRFIDQIQRNGCEVVIPPRDCRNEKREFDSFRYRERHLIECFVSKIKQFAPRREEEVRRGVLTGQADIYPFR